jgi:redox-sensitive bicupin YhaK (pirin superfamily)
MQILTVVLEGALAHEGSSGSKAILRAGDVQRMSAGRGVAHSRNGTIRQRL